MKYKFVQISLVILAIIALNFISSYYFSRWDLTEEKRYSISEATKNLLENISEDKSKEEVSIKVYLEGDDFPPAFKRLHDAVKETLDEFKIYGGTKINYRFIDPASNTDSKKREEFQAELIKKGLLPTNLVDNKNGRRVENLIFPWAIVSFGGKEVPVLLLKGNKTNDSQQQLNQSYENVEYELATAIRKLTLKTKKKIGLLAEFTKLKPINFAGLITSLQEYYDLFIINTKSSPNFQRLGLDAIILPKPDYPVDDSTKYKLDQFIVSGGRALFFMNGLKIDSVGLGGNFTQPLNLNLDDLFFKYGIRVNQNMVKDGLSSAVIPLMVGAIGDKPNVQLMPFRYFPLINNFGKSLIVKNLDVIYTKFPATIDTVKANGILKVPLLMTSPYTKVLNAPAIISYNEARKETDEKEYNSGIKTVAYLLEGKFESLYKNRILPSDEKFKTFKEKGAASKIIICSDGNIIVNDVDKKTGNPLPLGYDRYTQHTFGNQDFVMHALDYLVDENGVISARGKEVKLRPLDKLKTRDERVKCQLINMILPILFVIMFGIIRFYWRRRAFLSH